VIMLEKEIKIWLRVAKEAAIMAGQFLLKSKKSAKKITKDSGRDIKIRADVQSESIILEYLRKQSDFSILSEEKGLVKRSEQDFTWIVDPLDGSLNFLRGIPISCVSIALWEKENPLIGIIYDFNKEELFTGIVGKGAWLNKKPILVSTIKEKRKAVLFTGIPVKADTSPKSSRSLMYRVSQYKKARWLGSAALSLAYVALGRGDAYLEKGIMLWDVAAGIALVRAAGGGCLFKKSKKNNSFSVYAANRKLFRKEPELILMKQGSTSRHKFCIKT